MTPSENLSKPKSGEANRSVYNAPCPPLEEAVDSATRFSSRGLFEEVDDGLPKLCIVEVAIHRPP
jgi:hypothetical protein